jgi:hypothetical protein
MPDACVTSRFGTPPYQKGRLHVCSRATPSASLVIGLEPEEIRPIGLEGFCRGLEFLSGVGSGIRTHDFRNHNPTLYQLSYTHRADNFILAGASWGGNYIYMPPLTASTCPVM